MNSFEHAAKHTPETPSAYPVRKISGLEQGGEVPVFYHPEIVGVESSRLLPSDLEVAVVTSEVNEPESIPFNTYLQLIGVRYFEYRKAAEAYAADHDGVIDNDVLLYNLHKGVLHDRQRRAKKYKAGFEESNREEDKESVVDANSLVFAKTFNDLGLDSIEVYTAEETVDIVEGVDDYMIVGDTAIAIQRSFKDKTTEVRGDRWRIIPEHPEYGRMVRVFVPESDEDTRLDPHSDITVADLLHIKQAKKAQESGKQFSAVKTPPLYTVLGNTPEEGMFEQIRRARTILSGIDKELQIYEESSDDEYDREQIAATRSALLDARKEMAETYKNIGEREKPDLS